MQPRRDAAHNFSSFAEFASDSFSCWQTDPVLLRSMQASIVENELELPLSAWALYWHKHWKEQSHRLAEGHLAAHLQEPCFWAAEKVSSRLQRSSIPRSQYGLSDCFQIAIAQFRKVLKTFRVDRGANLKTFASLAFHSFIVNRLRQQREIDFCSNWQLLRKLTRKQFLETMRHEGFSEPAIAQYRLAWMCYKRVYVQLGKTDGQLGLHQVAEPTETAWEAIANLYNQERLTQLTEATNTETLETMQQWMQSLIKWARNYLNPDVKSLNTPRPGYESGEVQDSLMSGTDGSLIEGLLSQEAAEERQQQRGLVNGALQEALQELKPEARELLQLYYGEYLTQQAIADQMGMPQYKVSRRLSQTRKKLLKGLAEWSQEQWQVELTKDALVGMGEVLEEWLQQGSWVL